MNKIVPNTTLTGTATLVREDTGEKVASWPVSLCIVLPDSGRGASPELAISPRCQYSVPESGRFKPIEVRDDDGNLLAALSGVLVAHAGEMIGFGVDDVESDR
jgi:hypothetical protein